MQQNLGAIVKTPMTRAEACQILNITEPEGEEEENLPVDHLEVMERYDILAEKNSGTKGGSFYVRSKIFFAKEHLMQDWPAELNVSKVDVEGGEEPEADDPEK